jgi:replicative DNA helicase
VGGVNELDAAFDDLTSNHYGELVRYLEAKSPARYALDRFLNAWTMEPQHARNGSVPAQTDFARALDGATFVDQVGDQVPALWGTDGSEILWSQGEPLMLVGPDGVGKTTLLQQLSLARIGFRGHKLLGLEVRPAAGKVLYVAADRPRQAASSFRRMVDTDDPGDRQLLEERLVVWSGPLPFNFPEDADGLPALADHHGVTDIFIDSLKDVAVDLSKDETGSRVARACQTVMAAGLELAISHHQRKEMNGGAKPRRLADVFGSRWITAAMGSVVLLWGEPGDPVVELRHLKQPVEEVGPHSVVHDHDLGASRLHQPVDLVQALWDAGVEGIAVGTAAKLVFGVDSPSPSEVEKTRRKLE